MNDTTPMPLHDLLAVLRAFASADIRVRHFGLHDAEALALLTEQFAAHGRAERKRCEKVAIEVWATKMEAADRAYEKDRPDCRTNVAVLGGEAGIARNIANAIAALQDLP